jgi:hypothetical protein
VLDRIQENEAVKLIRVKEGLLKLSDSYLELAHKCHVIHEAHRDVAYQIPDVHSKGLHEMRYSGITVNNIFCEKLKGLSSEQSINLSLFACVSALITKLPGH